MLSIRLPISPLLIVMDDIHRMCKLMTDVKVRLGTTCDTVVTLPVQGVFNPHPRAGSESFGAAGEANDRSIKRTNIEKKANTSAEDFVIGSCIEMAPFNNKSTVHVIGRPSTSSFYCESRLAKVCIQCTSLR